MRNYIEGIFDYLAYSLWLFGFYFVTSRTELNKRLMGKDINRIKVVLAEKKRTNKWLSEQLGRDPATVSKWVTNTAQPSLENLIEIAKCLEVDINELIRK